MRLFCPAKVFILVASFYRLLRQNSSAEEAPSTQRQPNARCSRLTALYVFHSLSRSSLSCFLAFCAQCCAQCCAYSSYSCCLDGFSQTKRFSHSQPVSSRHSRRGHRRTSRELLKRGDRVFPNSSQAFFWRVFCLLSATSVHRIFHTLRTLRSVCRFKKN
jgi:hypothetical protein